MAILRHTPIALLGTLLISGGLLFGALATSQSASAQVTPYRGQGAVVQSFVHPEPALWNAEVVLPAAPAQDSAVPLLALGMVLILIGFALHALLTLRLQDRPVPVRVRKKQTPDRTSRQQLNVIWVERTIRF